jgi:hypothetical protein
VQTVAVYRLVSPEPDRRWLLRWLLLIPAAKACYPVAERVARGLRSQHDRHRARLAFGTNDVLPMVWLGRWAWTASR